VSFDNQIAIPAQLNKVKGILAKLFKNYIKLEGCGYSIRQRTSDPKCTTWRLIIRLELRVQTFRDEVYDFFMRNFLHKDADYPHIMTWKQVLDSEILPFTNLERYVASKQSGFVPGEATHSIERRITEWIQRRNTHRSMIEAFMTDLNKEMNTHPMIQVKNELQKHEWINEMEYNETEFQYRVNCQRIPNLATPSSTEQQNNNNMYYTQALSKPSSSALYGWIYQPSISSSSNSGSSNSSSSSFLHCPYIYNDMDVSTHKNDMQLFGFVSQQLDTVNVLFP